MKKIIASPHAPKAVGPYSQAVEAGGALYVSGQLPIDGATGKMAEGVEAQTHRSLTNLRHILEEGGYTLGDVVKTTVLLQDIGDFAAMNAVYARKRRRGFPPADKCVSRMRGASFTPFVNNLWIKLVCVAGFFHIKESFL